MIFYMESRKPITIRLKPSVLRSARIEAAKMDMRLAEWLEAALRAACKGWK
jgi:predicted HicB family RNase H-like nuclease